MSTREISFQALVAEHSDNKDRDIAYRFSNGRTFESTDHTSQGVYGVDVPDNAVTIGGEYITIDGEYVTIGD